MKIAIIGGGFYGLYFAFKIKQKYPKIKITIFEKNKKFFLGASSNNQYRVHQGFHYPRSPKTIDQTKIGFKKFLKEFGSFIINPKKNIYLIHKNSKVSFQEYKKIYKRKKIFYKEIDLSKIKTIRNINDFQGAIMVNEKIANMKKIFNFFKKKLKNVTFKTSCNVYKINSKSGLVYFKNNIEKYNFIINTTFVNPNLGLIKKKFHIKYELASIVELKNAYLEKEAATIMDGPYVSIYPVNQSTHTFSSVKYTPLKKFNTFSLYKKFLEKKNLLHILKNNANLIINDVKKYFLIKNYKINRIYFAPKIKIKKDIGEYRCSEIICENKIFSVLCGKLDSVFYVWDKIDICLKKKY